jgi:hypothetical protein
VAACTMMAALLMRLSSSPPRRLRGVKGVPEPLKAVPAVELLGAGSLAAGLLRYSRAHSVSLLLAHNQPIRPTLMLHCSFILGLWPVFGFLSPLIVVVTFYGGVMSLSFVPGFGLLRPAGDLVSGVRKQA